jgi:hypothetical protein
MDHGPTAAECESPIIYLQMYFFLWLQQFVSFFLKVHLWSKSVPGNTEIIFSASRSRAKYRNAHNKVTTGYVANYSYIKANYEQRKM